MPCQTPRAGDLRLAACKYRRSLYKRKNNSFYYVSKKIYLFAATEAVHAWSRTPQGHDRIGGRPGACSCLARARGWRVVCTVGMRYAPFGPLWLRRSGPRKACGPQLCRHLPQGSFKVCGRLRSPHRLAAPLSPLCQRVSPQRWCSVALGCHGLPRRLCGAASHYFTQGVYPLHPRARASLAGLRYWEQRCPARASPAAACPAATTRARSKAGALCGAPSRSRVRW